MSTVSQRAAGDGPIAGAIDHSCAQYRGAIGIVKQDRRVNDAGPFDFGDFYAGDSIAEYAGIAA